MRTLRLGLVGTLALTAAVVVNPGRGGAAEVTTPVEMDDIWDGPGHADPRGYVALDDLVLFSADDGVSGRELWVFDTTTDDTTLIDVVPGPTGSEPWYLAAAGGHVFFNADDGTGDRELWKTDGTGAGTARVENINPSGSSNPWGVTALGDLVVFSAVDGIDGQEPWVSDGTAGGTMQLADINTTGGSFLDGLIAFDGNLYFSAYDGAERPLWKTDGTTAGTQQMSAPGAPDRVAELAVLGDVLLFEGDRRLWKTDGTAAGTEMVHTAAPGEEEDQPTFITASGDHAFFWAGVGLNADELWVTDGTSMGTRVLTDQVNTSNDPIGSLGNGSVVVAIHTDDDGEEPWISDGTVAGTKMLDDLVAGTGDSDPRGMSAHNGFVFFSAVTPALGEELYVTDGITVELVDDINTGIGDGVRGGNFEDEYDATILSDGIRLYFTATTAAHGTEPWMLDAFADPPAPTSVAATAGDATATVSWTTPDASLSGPITGYQITGAPGGGCTTTGATSCDVTGLTNGTPYTFTVVASTAHGVSPPSDPSPAVTPRAPRFIPLPPARILETRPNGFTVDGLHQNVGVVAAGTTYELDVVGRAGVPTGAAAASLNVTVVAPHAPGFITVYACGTARPDASNVNYFPTGIVPNAVLTPIGTNGKICIYTLATTHILVDINGAFEPNSGFTPLNPARLLETRSGFSTIDGQHNNTGLVTAGTTYELDVIGRAGVPTGATAASLNVTAVFPHAPGFITVYACGTARPDASNINYFPGLIAPNAVLTPIGTNGKICIYTLAATHLLVDINGAFEPDSGFTPLTPARILESRAGFSTVDGLHNNTGLVTAGTTYELDVTGRAGVPAGATAASLNVTAVFPHDNGYITVYACGAPLPDASNVNYFSNNIVPNAVLTPIGANGKVCIYTLATTHILVDINGAFVP